MVGSSTTEPLTAAASAASAAAAAAAAAASCTASGGGDQQAVMQELIKSAQRPVSAGKVRRKKAKDELKRIPPRDKSKGFAKAR
jgi:hypothetical protein